MKSIQVKHSGELGREHRERERDVANWGENRDAERKRRGFKLRSTLVDFDRCFKSIQGIFYQHKDILRHGKQSNRHRKYFWIDVCLQPLFGRYIFSLNNTGLHHIIKLSTNF